MADSSGGCQSVDSPLSATSDTFCLSSGLKTPDTLSPHSDSHECSSLSSPMMEEAIANPFGPPVRSDNQFGNDEQRRITAAAKEDVYSFDSELDIEGLSSIYKPLKRKWPVRQDLALPTCDGSSLFEIENDKRDVDFSQNNAAVDDEDDGDRDETQHDEGVEDGQLDEFREVVENDYGDTWLRTLQSRTSNTATLEDVNTDDMSTSSGFDSGGGAAISYDNLSSSDGSQINCQFGGIILEPGHGLLHDYEDFEESFQDDDESLDAPVARLLKRASCSNIKARENACLSIRPTLQQVMQCSEDVLQVMALFKKLAYDQSQSVRIELVEQIPQLAVLCHEYPQQLAYVMDDHLLPLTLLYVTNPVSQLRKTTQAALLVMLEQHLLEEEQVRHVCEQVALLTLPPCPRHLQEDLNFGPSHVSRSEDDRADAVALISRMAPIIGQELTTEFFLDKLSALCQDSSSHLRKICAGNFGEFTVVCGTHTTESVLLPLFVSLCKDWVWEVRRACTESFMAVSASCLMQTRHDTLANIYVQLLRDTSRWVRVAAFQYLGMFISTFAATEIYSQHNDDDNRPNKLSLCSGEERKEDYINEDYPEEEIIDTIEASNEYFDTTPVAEIPPLHSVTSSPLCFLGEERECSSPLPPYNLLHQSYSPPSFTEDPSFNSFNYWRVPLPDFNADDIVSRCLREGGMSENDESEVSSDVPVETLHLESSADAGEEIDHSKCFDEDKTKDLDTRTNSDDEREVENSKDNECTQVEFEVFQPEEIEEEEKIVDTAISVLKPCSRRRTYDSEDDCSGGRLERAPQPMTYAEVVASDDLNDSSDSDDTVIEMTTLGEFVEEQEMDSYELFKEGVKRRLAAQERRTRDSCDSDSNVVWMLSDVLDALPIELDYAKKVKAQSVVPQNLLEQYLVMTDPRRADSEDKEITRHCAFAMPAVAMTLGRQNWPVLRDTYKLLSKDYQWRVRRTLAYSMHEMAMILGPDHATADLLPLYEEFTSEPECVKIGMLDNLAQFVRNMPYSARQKMLPSMANFYGSTDRRQRQEFGKQLAQLLKLYPPTDVNEHLKDFCFTLLTDNVVCNRQYVYGLISLLIERLGCKGDIEYVTGVCKVMVKDFAENSTWSRRQTFVFVAGRVFADGVLALDMYCEHMLPALLTLASDRVPNVRLAVAEVMSNNLVHHPAFNVEACTHAESVQKAYAVLQRDSDRDVRYFANSPLSDRCSILEQDCHDADYECQY